MKTRSDNFVEFFVISLKNLLSLLQTARNQNEPLDDRANAIQTSHQILQAMIEDVDKGDLPEIDAGLCKKLSELYHYARHQLDLANQVETTEEERFVNFTRCEVLYQQLRKGFAGVLKKAPQKSKGQKKSSGPIDVH